MVRRLGMVVTMLVLMNLAMGVVAGRGVSGVSAQDLTCDDFASPDAAQALLDADDSFEDALDPDGDGEACTDDDLAELEDQDSQDDDDRNQDDEESNQDDEEASGEEALTARFGSAREDFEDEYGDPVSDEEEAYPVGFEYEVDGFRSVTVFFRYSGPSSCSAWLRALGKAFGYRSYTERATGCLSS